MASYGSTSETTWVTRDHLGSGTLVMDESGAALLYPRRRHSTIGYLSPVAFEAQMQLA